MNRIFRSATARPRLIQPPSSLLTPRAHRSFATTTSSPPPPLSPSQRGALWYARLGVVLVAHGLFWSFLGTYIVEQTVPLAKGLKSTSVMDSDDTTVFERAADNNRTVKSLRSNPDYEEVRPWGSLTDEQRKKALTPGLLAGNGKIQYNRVWVNRNDGSTVVVLGLGRKLTGYPETIHGGLIATITDEALGRTALNVLPTRNAATAKLTLTYKRPAIAQRPSELRPGPKEFMVLRTWVVEHTDRKAIVQGRMEDGEGRTLVESDAVFVVPKMWKLAELPKEV
ncbi:HotDog domain-containing protein [Tuber brumale]|nr:HotDog domain-containing protein [Tuber brumale]